MSAPDGIWAAPDADDGWRWPVLRKFPMHGYVDGTLVHYTRSDLIPTAAYVAGLESAAKRALEEAVADDMDTWFEGLRAALSARPDAPDTYIKRVSLADLEGYGSTTQPADTRVVTVAQLDRWLVYVDDTEIACNEIRAIIGDVK